MIRTLIALLAMVCVRCVPVPTAPDTPNTPLTNGGFFVVCEGLWRQDNATLSYVTPSGNAERDVVSSRNAGLRLGDTGSDILVQGDSVFVCVSTSGTIEIFHRVTGNWQGRIRFMEGQEPYRIVRANDSIAYCSILNQDAIAEVRIKGYARDPYLVFPVGPAPEGLCVYGDRIYVANSGLGDLRKNESGSGTVSILDTRDLRLIRRINGLSNVMSCVADSARGRIWITYRNLASQPDSLGGVVLIDPATDSIIDHQRYASPKGLVIDPQTGVVYILHRDGIDAFDPRSQARTRVISHSSTNGNDVWYSLGWWKSQRALPVGNARTYVTDGEVIALDLNGTVRFKAGVGLNPAAFGD
ncbi:MAG: hypothetical protein NTX15_11345 [Candidatus Kapabacteria bacterium]|nr:hypothetical protein [Candidatus Kapabacteria bacterium]